MLLVGLLIMAILAVLNAAPLTFFTMLFVGNLGAHIGFLELLPGAIAIFTIKNNIFSFTQNKGK